VVDTICPNYPYGNYGVSGMPNSSFVWMVAGGQIINSNGADSIEVQWNLNASVHMLNVIEISEYGCVGDTVTAEVVVASSPIAEIFGPDSVCTSQTVMLTASSAQSYLWSGGQTTPAVQVKVLSDTIVSVKINDGCGVDSTSFAIKALPNPVADFTWVPSVVRAGKTATFTSSSTGAQFFSWIVNGDTLNKHQSVVYHTFPYKGNYEVVLLVENEYLCFDTTARDIEVRELLVNTITPNGDGINDVWRIPELEGNDNCKVRIFDRWNGEVFYSEGYQDPWDGKHNGNDVPEGSYFYIIDYGDGSEPIKGVITVIR
jgi:gliding motility-associated-like protein